ncbi:NACHT and WD repeat domain-containing protein [Kutzneria kofuensis]|uniref:WD40 repeat protein/energy-coupling factor transporter ATP-binding protein EcfA2 n=1 Tax=Kutzneria kofuensis TaxID=103725 RepID=A0A7W9NL30_9PSEU|nr:NACHT and WD repeat domain-containing protein [Kutzneria kofuensis]MBB5897247.1 WD40 repeat protein/energy-coupling factor transporter ATP-binding protein EcfA2 [Kutzneria kofuensis]
MPRSERPLDPGDTPLLRFAADLRKLRESAGSPVYRQLSVKAHYSVAVLSEAAGGRKLPSLAVTLAYVDACGGDLAEWEQKWRAVADVQEAPADADNGQAPYPGLSAFQIEDAARFHGRGALLAHLSNQILDRRLVVVFGASGAGKSSLLRAGLAAAGLRDGIDGLGPQPTVVFTPGPHPFDECALGLSRLTAASVTEMRTELRADPTALHLRLRQVLADQPASRDALIIVDQFEEVFTLCADEDERLAFITALLHVASAPTSSARLVLGVRADFFGHCLQYPQLRGVLGEGPVLVGAMTADELRVAITKPAADLGYTVETALVTRLVSEATNQPGVLPLMSHALLETWRRRQGITLTAAGYDAAGGISHALSRTAESVYIGLSAEQQAVARQVFLRLTALGDGTEDTRRRVDRAELDHVDGLDEVLTALVDARLVTVDRDSVDIAHEALISHWPRLREWLTEDRDGLRAHRQLTEAAEIWDSLNRDDGALYRGARLELARDWVKSRTPSLSHRERAFFDRSVDVCQQELLAAKRQARRQRRFIALLVVLLVALSGTTAYSLITQQTVAQQRDDATVQNVIDRIPTVALGNRELAAELAVAVYRLDPTPRTRGLLLAASTAADRIAFGIGETEPILSPALNSTSTLYAYQLGRTIRVASSRTGDPEVVLPEPPADDLSRYLVRDDFALSGDGSHLAVVRQGDNYANVVELWDISDVRNPKVVRSYPTDTGVVVAFTPDSRVLAISSAGEHGSGTDTTGKTITSKIDLRTWLWDVTDPTASQPMAVLPEAVRARQFSADGSTLITIPVSESMRTGKDDFTSVPDDPWKIWDLKAARSGQAVQPLETKAVPELDDIGVSPDGRLFAGLRHTDGASTLSLFRKGPSGALTKIGEVTSDVITSGPVAFSPDGKRLAARQGDDTAIVWDVGNPAAPSEFASIPGLSDRSARLVSFTSDGRLTVVGGSGVETRGLDPDAATTQICAAVSKSALPRDKWAPWGSFFPSMDVPEPCSH